jgi:hypothetical protein
MDGIITILLELIKDTPGYFTLTIGFIVIVFAMYLKVRDVSIKEITSIGRLQAEQATLLLTQITQLSTDLAAARSEISVLYNKIDELEDMVRVYRSKLRDTEEPK